MKKVLCAIGLCIILGAANAYSISSSEDMDMAIAKMMNFRLNVRNCPTLYEVASKRLTNVKYDNVGGTDSFYCYAKLMGMQPNNDVFSIVFRYDIESGKCEPFSLRIGKKLYVKLDDVQKNLVKFYASESEEVRQVIAKLK